jgi:hypothetical protein
MMSSPLRSTTCLHTNVRITRFAEVIYETNRYSVPSKFAYRAATVGPGDDRIVVMVDSIVAAEHQRASGKHKAILDLVHFIDRLSSWHYGVVLGEVLRRRRFYHSLQSLLNGYVDRTPATASKRFTRVVTLLEHYTMQRLYDAIDACARYGTDDPKSIATMIKQLSGMDDDPLNVYDSEEWRTDRHNYYYDQVAPTAHSQIGDLD